MSDPNEASLLTRWARLQGGAPPRVLDLFSGCGGFSLGFLRAGCQILGGVEIDLRAAETHARNFHNGDPLHAKTRNITETPPLALLQELAPGLAPNEAVDILIGGPPCPAFARVGRAKLRDVRRDEQAYKNDPRAQLYLPYLEYVEALRPLALVMENVPDIMNFGGHNLGQEIAEVLEDLGYASRYSILNAAAYGAPQMRQRFMLIAWHRVTGVTPGFPEATHDVVLPPGYAHSQNVALKTIREGDRTHWSESARRETGTPAVTVRDAIRDLPPIRQHLTGELRRGARDLTERVRAGLDATPWVVENMQTWPGLAHADGTTAHVIRSLSWRDYRIFREMKEDDEYPAAWEIAHRHFEAWLTAFEQAGGRFTDALPEAAGLADALAGVSAQLDARSDSEAVRRWVALRPTIDALVAHGQQVRAQLPKNPKERWPTALDLPDELRAGWEALGFALQSLAGAPGPTVTGEAAAKLTRQQVGAWRQALANAETWQLGLEALKLPAQLCQQVNLLPCPDWDGAAFKELTGTLEELESTGGMFWGPPLNRDIARQALALRVRAFSAQIGEFSRIKALFVPPYDPRSFPNKWRKMHRAAPARTLMAHLGKDSYSHIHYDDTQARTLSVREAARLQSFPDDFVFCGSMNDGFRQIGNAVPPMLAWAIARRMTGQIQAPQGDIS